jgi:hypothetical protein
MGGGALIKEPYYAMTSGFNPGGTADHQATRLALRLTCTKEVTLFCRTQAQADDMKCRVEEVLRWAGCFPVKKYIKRLTIHATQAQPVKLEVKK